MSEKHFITYWESTLPPNISEQLAAHWREWELSGVERGKILVEYLEQFIELSGVSVLDLGSGYGGISVAVSQVGALATGIDIDFKRLIGARIRTLCDHPFHLAQGSGEELPFRNCLFDLIICNDVLEHVSSQEQLLSEIARVLKPRGWLYLEFPNRLSPDNLIKDPHYGLRGISVLPPSLGRWYVVSLRRKSATYNVGVFPIASVVVHKLNRLGFKLRNWRPAPRRETRVLSTFLKMYRLNTQATVTLLCQKT